jgi:hypothetical protein
MATLTRDAILAADDLAKETVAVPEWGGEVIVSTMTGEARDAWEQSLLSGGGKVNMKNLRARLLAYAAVDESGTRLFTEADAEKLGKKSSKALERCVKVIQKLNGMTDKDLEDAKGN